jgi:hypothetical protein
MKKIELFKKSVINSQNEAYDVTFHATEDCEIVATVENSAAQITHQDVGLVDLSGRKTRLPVKIHMALHTPQISDKQKKMLDSFQRICVARLAWSIACFTVL